MVLIQTLNSSCFFLKNSCWASDSSSSTHSMKRGVSGCTHKEFITLFIRALDPDPDPEFHVNPDPDPIRMQNFDDQKLKKKKYRWKIFWIKKCNLLLSMLQEKTSALKREHPALKKWNLFRVLFCLWVIFSLLDPDTVPGMPLNPDPIRIRIHSTAVYGRDQDPHFQDQTTFR